MTWAAPVSGHSVTNFCNILQFLPSPQVNEAVAIHTIAAAHSESLTIELGGEASEEICILLCTTANGRRSAGGGFRPVDRYGHDRRADRHHRRPHQNVGGIQVPDTTKAKAVITQELIDRQASGQTILNVLNLCRA